MSEISKCNRCGTPLPPDSPEGLCPRCLIAMNLATQTEIPGETGPAKPPPAPPLPVADVAKLFPQLEILECLGRGGMGAVYKARQPRLDRLVALKILSPEKQGNQKFSERFEREARALARLHHPNIVAVFDFGEVQGNFYLLMEFVDGLTLRQVLQDRQLAPGEALAIVPKICEALQYAHEQGIVHRDIKPENILMDKSGRLKIADFGIAKILGDGERTNLTEEQAIGTPHYMSPEQIEKPQTVDHRADIYSLGVVFYEMLTGELPLGKFQAPSKKVHIDVRLDEIVLRALEKEPDRRYQHASEVKTQVETVAATPGKTSGDGTPIENQSQFKSIATNQKPRLSRAAIIVGIIIIAVVAFMFVHHRAKAFNVVTLTESDFYQKFQSNQIEQAIITYNSANGSETISGKLLQADKNGKTNEVSFVVPNAVLTPTMEDKILPSDKVRINIPNPVVSDISYQLVFFVLFNICILFVPGIIIFIVWRVFRNKPERRNQEKPDHFWRRFAVVVLLLISIPFVISILGLLAAIAIPNFVRARQHSQELQQQRVVSTSFAIGQKWFPEGDSIEITSVEWRANETLDVKGHYNLISHETASLAFYVTSTNNSSLPEASKQTMQISKGSGDFELTYTNRISGLPHISMYADGHDFATVYFGDKEQAEKERKAKWITNSSPDSVETSSSELTPADKLFIQKTINESKVKLITLQEQFAELSKLNNSQLREALPIFTKDEQLIRLLRYLDTAQIQLEALDSTNSNAGRALISDIAATNTKINARMQGLLASLNSNISSEEAAIKGLENKLAEADGLSATAQSEPSDLREARAKLAELRVTHGDQNPEVQEVATRIKELERMSAEEPNASPELREAKAHLAELRVLVGDQNPELQGVSARINELERMSKEEPNAPPDLREAKAHLAEVRVFAGKQSPELQGISARIDELERMSAEEPNASPELREARAHLAEVRVFAGKQSPEVQQALAQVKALEPSSVDPSDNNPTVDEQPPVVVETFPVSGARDVAPGETEIRVRFSKDMMDGSWSWSTAWENSTPDFIGSPRYDADARTCIAKVKLEPGRSYAFWLNSDNFHNFKGQDGRPSVPYLLIFHTRDATTIQSDNIGQTWFPEGDSIQITSVERTENQMIVKGHYNLVSHDDARLELHITTSSGGPTPTDSRQEIKIVKGSGDFELTHPHVVPGLPHVSMYGSNGHTFATVYFGTKEEAAKEAKATWITNSPSFSTLNPNDFPGQTK